MQLGEQASALVSKKLADLFDGLSTTFLGVPVGKMGFKWPEDGGRAQESGIEGLVGANVVRK